MYKRILVTGGAGFIGSHFANMLHKKGHNVVVVDKLTYAGNLDNLNPVIEFHQMDINEINSSFEMKAGIPYCDFMRNVDCIVNFAAESHVDRSLRLVNDFYEANFLGVANLLEVAKELEVKRFVQVSTDEVYGSADDGYEDFEADMLLPGNPYSASKAAAEMLVHAYHKTYGLNTVITRGSNTYGPGQYPEKLIPMACVNLLNNKKIPIYGNGSARRSYLYVKDHARAIQKVMNNGKNGEIYNICGTIEINTIQVITKICDMMGRNYEENVEFVEDRLGHDMRYRMNDGKLLQLGFKYKHPNFEKNLQKTMDYAVALNSNTYHLKRRGTSSEQENEV